MPWVQPCEGSPRSAACTASRSLSAGWKGSPVGRPRAARTATDSPGLSSPAATWWWSMAATRRRRVAGAAGHEKRKSTTDCGSAGNGWMLLTAQWSVNSAQSPAYAARVRADNTRGAGAVPISIVVVMTGVRGRGG